MANRRVQRTLAKPALAMSSELDDVGRQRSEDGSDYLDPPLGELSEPDDV